MITLTPEAGAAPLAFSKYQGTGNDFVILDRRALGPRGAPPTPREAVALCDRHFGIGADGVLTVLAAAEPTCVARMHVTNADGSHALMCGNGLRCVALFLVDRMDADASALSASCALCVETDSGVRAVSVTRERAGKGAVTVGMGRARVEAVRGAPVRLTGMPVEALAVDVGNPHLVLRAAPAEGELALAGPTLSRHPHFPDGCNVEWLERLPDGSLRVTVFERGVGPTLACGTGAVAAAHAAEQWGLATLRPDQLTAVHLPGGTVEVGRTPDGEAVLRGGAQRVFVGDVG